MVDPLVVDNSKIKKHKPAKVIKKMKRERVYNRYKRRDNYEY